MILDMFFGKHGKARAFILRVIVAFAACGAWFMYSGYIDWKQGGKFGQSSALDFLIVLNTILAVLLASSFIVLLTQIYREWEGSKEEIPKKEEGMEEKKYPWTYMLSVADSDVDMEYDTIYGEATEFEIMRLLRKAETLKLPSGEWNILLQQEAVKKIPDARKLCITNRKRALEREANKARSKEQKREPINLSPIVSK